MSIALVRLPEDIEQGARGGPRFSTSIVALSSGAEQRNAAWEYPLARWDVGYGIDTKAQYSRLIDFFMARLGRHEGFLFKDWTDYEAEDEAIGTGDGTERSFILYKNYTVGAATFQRRITRPVTDTVVVKVAGVEVDSGDYTIGTGGWIQFAPGAVPAVGEAVTWSGEFDIPVRFDTDALDVTAILEDAGEIDSIPVVEMRDNINAAPTGINFTRSVTTLPEMTDTSANVFLGDVVAVDDPFGDNEFTLSGADADYFELGLNEFDEPALYLKAGTTLDYELKSSYTCNVIVDDEAVEPHPAATQAFTLTVTDVNEAPLLVLENKVNSVPQDLDTSSAYKLADIAVLDDSGTRTLTLTGADASAFQIIGALAADEVDPATGWTWYRGAGLYLKAGFSLISFTSIVANMELGLGQFSPLSTDSGGPVTTEWGIDVDMALGLSEGVAIGAPKSQYNVTVNVDDAAAIGSHPSDSEDFVLTVGVVAGTDTISTAGAGSHTVREYGTLVVELWGGGAGAPGVNGDGADGGDTSVTALGLIAHGGDSPPASIDGAPQLGPAALFNGNGGAGGVATVVGDSGSENGEDGGNGVYSGTPNTFGEAQDGRVVSGKGGDSPEGGAGGASVRLPDDGITVADTATFVEIAAAGNHGAAPGGGGSGAAYSYADMTGSTMLYARPGGGAGEYLRKVYTRGAPGSPTPGAVLALVVGAGGDGGDKGAPLAYNDGADVDAHGGDGAVGRVRFTWS